MRKNFKNFISSLTYLLAMIISSTSAHADVANWLFFGFNDDSYTTETGPIIIYNMTNMQRQYQVMGPYVDSNDKPLPAGSSFSLGAGQMCALDTSQTNGQYQIYGSITTYVEDITNGHRGLFNGPDDTANNNLDDCSNEGENSCAGSMWGSWAVGIENIGPSSIFYGSGSWASGQARFISGSWNKDNEMYFFVDGGGSYPFALLFVEGTTDGSGFNPWLNNNYLAPSIRDINFIQSCALITPQNVAPNPNPYPQGSYLQTCHDITYNPKTLTLTATCSNDGGGNSNPSTLVIPPGLQAKNINGVLQLDI